MLELGLGMAGGARGWLRVGQAFGVLLLPGLGLAAPAPRFLGIQPPCATQALNFMLHKFTLFSIFHIKVAYLANKPVFQVSSAEDTGHISIEHHLTNLLSSLCSSLFCPVLYFTSFVSSTPCKSRFLVTLVCFKSSLVT